MPYTIVDNFSAGLDNRRHILNSKPGTLAKAENVHITRGGEIEKRKAFSLLGESTNNICHGLESTASGVYTFSWTEDPTPVDVPAPIKYQALVHPWGERQFDYIQGMDTPVLTTVFGGKIFALAKYLHSTEWSVNKSHCIGFYDGIPIKDWYEGIIKFNHVVGGGEISSDCVSYFSTTLTPGYTAEDGFMGPHPGDPNFIVDLDGFVNNGSWPTWTHPHADTQDDQSYVITGKPGINFTVVPIQTDSFKVDVFEIQKKVDYVAPTEATATLNIIAGAENAAKVHVQGRNFPGEAVSIRSIRINASSPSSNDGTDILGWTSPTGLQHLTFNPTYTTGSNYGNLLYNIAKVINDNTTGGLAHGYKAYSRRLYKNSGNDTNAIDIYAPADEGENANGWLVQIEFDSNPSNLYDLYTICDPASVIPSPYNNGKFIATMGTLSGGTTNQVVSIKIDGVEVLGAPVDWQESNGFTASLVRTQINTFSSSVEYETTISGSLITFKGVSGQGALMNNKSIRVETLGNVIVTTSGTFNGGINAVVALPKKVRVRYQPIDRMIGPKAGAKYGATITGSDNPTDPFIIGASRMADTFGKDPSFVFTYKSKVYVGFDSIVYFSALNDCTKWDIYDLGSGFIDMSNNFGGRENLTGCGVYQDKMVFFTSRSSQTWYMDPDPSNNKQIQVIENSGCISTESVLSMGALDLIYLGDDGFRSLRARENTDSAYSNDIGSPIDDIVTKDLETIEERNVSQTQFFDFGDTGKKGSVRGIIEPIFGRIMMFLVDKVYVLSHFGGANISAWSTYQTGLGACRGVTRFENTIYMLCIGNNGKQFYTYGGLAGTTYDSCPVDVEMPYLDTGKPATFKEAKGVDITCEGQWSVFLGFDHTNVPARDLIANVFQSTFAVGKITATGYGTHFGPKFTSVAQGPARIANFMVHFDERHSKHEAG
ncbi:hypothetical protein UFOVP543_29 [uncultured Caudovirales phage]|uniref:Uncharacterized protein n=1 Tax=uncultured Caudovirales phage TaxID=2100421 RepID=A0A6J5MXQ7_9CAUD|nr:hypothetical protein UFOVP543_29 [uncultured Caudovirales phage]CAB4163264.1 hypothetical protein UFOVP804_5 [uncultured Caudovirales phage]